MDFEKEILTIQERNQRVEMDKRWETSWFRRLVIAIITYVIAAAWLWVIDEKDLWWKAAIPSVGYILSTLTLPSIKKWWTKINDKN